MPSSRALRALTAAALAAGLAAATTVSAEPVDSESTFFVRQQGCGTAQEAGYLSVEQGTDSAHGCGAMGGLPVTELANEAWATGFGEPLLVDEFTATDGVPVVLDAERDIEGVFSTRSWTGTPGAGIVRLDIALSGTRLGSNGRPQFVDLGSGTFEATALPPATTYGVPFSFDLPEALQGVELTSLTLTVTQRGISYNAGAQSLNGTSYVTLPSLVEPAPVEEAEGSVS